MDFCFFPVSPPTSPQFDNTTLLPCITKNDCLSPEVSQCHKMPFGTGSGKSGYCVPYQCKSDKDCLTIGDACTSGALSGTCKKKKSGGICQYQQVLFRKICGKKGSEKNPQSTLNKM